MPKTRAAICMNQHVKQRLKSNSSSHGGGIAEADFDYSEGQASPASNKTRKNLSYLNGDSALDRHHNLTAEESAAFMFDDCTVEPMYNVNKTQDKRAHLAKLTKHVNQSEVIKKAQDLIKFKRQFLHNVDEELQAER